MASNYGALTVGVDADTRAFTRQVDQAAANAGKQASQQLSKNVSKGLGDGAKGAEETGRSIGSLLGQGLSTTLKAGVVVGGAVAAAAAGFGVQAARAAMRVDELDTAMQAIGKSSGVGYQAMNRTAKAVKAQGIEMASAQGVAIQFARANLNMADATKLARVAQDAAVISQTNSTDAADQLMHGIETLNVRVLRQQGILVDANQAYAAYAQANGTTVGAMSQTEKQQAFLNAVLEEGSKIAGTYELSMQQPGKLLRSFPRLFNDAAVSIGQGFTPALGAAIKPIYDLTKGITDSLSEGGKLHPVVVAIGDAVTRMLGPVQRGALALKDWFASLSPDTIDRVVGAISRFGPQIATVGGGLAVMTGAKIMQGIPGLGNVIGALTGPLSAATKGIGNFIKDAGGIGAALKSPMGALGLFGAAFGILMAVSPEFRAAVMDVVQVLISALMPVFSELWNAIKPLLPILMDLVRMIGRELAGVVRSILPVIGPLASLLGQVLVIAVQALVQMIEPLAPVITILVQAFADLLVPILDLLIPVIRVLVAVLQFLMPVIKFLAPVILACISPIFGWMLALKLLGAAMSWLWGKVISPVWNAIKFLISLYWTYYLGPIFNAFKLAVQLLGSVMSWLYGAVIKPVWGAIGNAISWAWTRVIQPVWNAMKSGLGLLRDAFEGAKNFIAGVWNGLKDAVAIPVRFVAFSIINPLIKGANVLLDKIGLKIPEIPKFATGGRVPGGWGGGDRQLIWAEPGEWVLTKQQARAIGYHRLHGLPHYTEGGYVGPSPLAWWNPVNWGKGLAKGVAGGFGELLGLGGDILSAVGGLIRYAAFKAFEAGTTPLRKLLEKSISIDSPHFFTGALSRFGISVIDKLLEFIRGKSESEEFLGGGMAVDEVAKIIMQRFPQLRVTSALRPGDPGYHGKNLARDLGGPTSVMGAAGEWTQNNLREALLEGIHRPSAGFLPLSVKNGKAVPPGFWGAATWAAHADHLHLAAEAGLAARGGNVGTWIAEAMRKTGVSPAVWMSALALQVKNESGGNPRAVNNWDINARRGDPSKGIMQTITSTFLAYMLPGMGDIWNPVHNIAAAIRYIIARYGASANSLGRWRPGGGYDAGGWLPVGASLAVNNTGRPEPVLTAAQWDNIQRVAGSRDEEVTLLRQVVRLLAAGHTIDIDGEPIAAAVAATTLFGVAS